MSAIIPGAVVEPDTREWLEHTPLATLECRTLRHQWPRMPRLGKSKSGHIPTGGGVVWRILGYVEAGRQVEREMTCLGGCGTARIEWFLALRDGRMVRDGGCRYRYPTTYLRKRTDPDQPLEALGQEEILGTLVRRLYPRLKW
jgi:hypothetical protein